MLMSVATRVTRWLLLIVAVVVLAGCHRLAIPAGTPSARVALKSYHGRYVIAQGEEQGWSLRQVVEPGQDDCHWFTSHHLGQDGVGNAQVALETCYGRFVTAPRRGATRFDREVWQESGLGDCGKFTLEGQGDGFALKTCAGTYLTAGDAGWEAPLQWGVVAETDKVQDWELFQLIEAR
jgi:hypothetical protein